jgi:hypothetical protein
MHLLFVDNLLYEGSSDGPKIEPQPHGGLMSLVAVARAGGHRTEVIDPKWEVISGRLQLDSSVSDGLAAIIAARNPDAVGFTALGCNFVLVIKAAMALRRIRPELPILLGGPHASILHQQILERFDVFDVVARHEAERTLLPILDHLADRGFGEIAGISYRNAKGDVVCNPGKPLIEDLDELPMPAYDAYPLAEFNQEKMPVEAGRGCPFSSTFCSTATFFGRRYRLKSAGRLVTELDHLHRTYGFTRFNLTHDLFTVNRKKILEFCEAVEDRGYGWGCSARVDCVDRELLRAMEKAGCIHIYFGIETGSRRMQSISCKRLDLDLVEPLVTQAGGLGIETTASFITGYPEEEAGDQADTLDLLGRLALRADRKTVGQLHMLTPEPGTALIAQYGERMRFDSYLSDFNLPLLDPTIQQLVEENREIFANYFHYPTALPRERLIFAIALFDAIRKIPRSIMRYLLNAYEGRLSLLVESAHLWSRTAAIAVAPTEPEFLVAFASATFGRDHHLRSLLRYASAVHRVRLAAMGSEKAGRIPRRGASLRLSSGSTVLGDIHDCAALMAKVDGLDRLLDHIEAGPLTSLLVKADLVSDEIATYCIDRSTASLLHLFAEPKTYAQFRAAASAGAAESWTWSDLRALCADGVLEAVETLAVPAECSLPEALCDELPRRPARSVQRRKTVGRRGGALPQPREPMPVH